jgi:hypothetical protein
MIKFKLKLAECKLKLPFFKPKYVKVSLTYLNSSLALPWLKLRLIKDKLQVYRVP